jgi:hypothetical protein
MLQIQKCQYVLCDLKKDTPQLNFRRAPRLFLDLFINIHCHAGLKFHGKLILEDSNLLNQTPDKLLVVFGEGDGLLTSVVPMHPAKNLATFAANDYLSEDVVAAEGSGLSVRTGMDNSAADKLFLHLHENFMRDNGLMVIFYIVLRNNAVVLNAFLY